MRISSSVALLLLAAACSGETPEASGPAAVAADKGKVLCATGGAGDFSRECTMERVAGPEGLVLTIRNPDGGFRKLLVTRDGRGVVAADGAEAAVVKVSGSREIEVTVGGDRYRLPATVKGKPLRP
ncbi:hypothetical protein [Sphingomonas jatrophae]|uniref:Lipoprotein n=1 Tax=Sphingomonas jatrophae TaxID=1166337 RepID=A0A1I6JEK9_9SPHN|nr:hypothetical protein [Sphingomonas jatrophae]SFR77279.1 hypothetical protein SAMN05192580_0166 [Sphingomonas jatrophae]